MFKNKNEHSIIYNKLEMLSMGTIQSHRAESEQKFSFLKILHFRTNENKEHWSNFHPDCIFSIWDTKYSKYYNW